MTGGGHCVSQADELQFSVSVYSEAQLRLLQSNASCAKGPAGVLGHRGWPCEMYGEKCPFRPVAEKMERMEKLLDTRLEFLERVLASQGAPVA